MPVCFQLTRKGEREPIVLQTLDAELCAHLGVECHPIHWVHGWYNWIGFALAMGSTFDQISERYYKMRQEDLDKYDFNSAWQMLQLININHYLAQHFTTDAWRELKSA